MAKSMYKIPSSLARSFLDHEIALSGGGWQLKPLPVKVLLFWVGSIMGVFWLVASTPLKHANGLLIALVVIWWFVATAFFGKYSKTKELNLTRVTAVINYFSPGARRVVTRRSSNPSGFYSIVGIDAVDDNGFIRWNDGSVGQAYGVVGSASVLVFAQDKKAILDRVDAFYRKVDTSSELIWMTTKEPQKIYRQLANLERLNLELEVHDLELHELLEERYSILTQHVGGEYSSIHQYLVIKADNLEALRRAHVVVDSEAEESALMLKQVVRLNGAETAEMFQGVYSAGA